MKKIEDMSTDELLDALGTVNSLIEQEKIRQAMEKQANVSTTFGMLGSFLGLLGSRRQRPQTVQIINDDDVIDAEWRYLEDGKR